MQVAQVLVEVFGIGLRRYPVNPWGAGLPRVAIGLAQEVLVDQVGQGRKDPIGIGAACAAIRWSFGVTVGDLNVSPVVLSSKT